MEERARRRYSPTVPVEGNDHEDFSSWQVDKLQKKLFDAKLPYDGTKDDLVKEWAEFKKQNSGEENGEVRGQRKM